MPIGFSELLIILLIVIVLFGAGRISNVMKELGKGVRNFKAGMNGEGETGENITSQNTTPPTPKSKSYIDANVTKIKE